MKITIYSLASHLIHSRIQLIREKLDINSGMLAAQVVVKNREYFDRAGKSVLIQHGISSEWKDFFDAAELLRLSFYPPPKLSPIRYPVVQMIDEQQNTWIDIKSFDNENGMVRAEADERMSIEQAQKRFDEIKQNCSDSNLRIFWKPGHPEIK